MPQKSLRLSDVAVENVKAMAKQKRWSFNQTANIIFEELNTTTPAKDENPRKAQKRKTRWPEDWSLSPEQVIDANRWWVSAGREDLLTYIEFDKFKTYCLANGKTYVNWGAAWRTWYTNAVGFNKPPQRGGSNGNHKQSDAERLAEQTQSLFSTDNQREGGGTLMDQDGTVISQ